MKRLISGNRRDPDPAASSRAAAAPRRLHRRADQGCCPDDDRPRGTRRRAAAAPTKAPAAAPTAAPAAAKPSNPDLILATTTSTQDSGLLDVLIPMFEKQTGYKVKTIAVGSGQAMTMGAKGEADVLLVHAPDSEKTFMKDGFGTTRLLVMHNDFIIVGPAGGPGQDQGHQDGQRGAEEDRRRQGPLRQPRRQLRHRPA